MASADNSRPVHLSFLVFLFIIAVLAGYMLPNMEVASAGASDGVDPSQIDGFGGADGIDPDVYTTLFYHATVLQGALSGLIAGQLSTGDIKAGVKHAVFMLSLSFVLFAVLI